MVRATSEVISENKKGTDLAVAIDDTSQNSRHTSLLNGVVSVTSVDTGNVLAKYCRVCVILYEIKKTSVETLQRSNGAMDVAAVFSDSVNRCIQYVKYLSDGDSKEFQKVIDDKPYGNDITVERLKCTSHM